MNKDEEVQPEQIEDYCRQLGLQLRDEQEMSIEDTSRKTVLGAAVDGQNSNENGQPIPPGHTKLAEQNKANFECKNCEKNFANSRQFLKHRCISKSEERSQTKSKGARKRGRKPRVKKTGTATEGASVEVDTDGNTNVSKAENEMEEQIDHLSDHTYTKDEVASLNQYTENTSDGKTVQCESCQLFAEIDPETINNPDKIPCEKCQELAAAAMPTLKSTNETGSNEENKKRRYFFKTEKKTCPRCKTVFHSQKRFDKHYTRCTKILVCSICNEDFTGNGKMAHVQYEAHCWTHIDTKPFTCEVCSRGFIRKADLDRHKIIHTDNYSPQRCTQCGAVFASAENLAKHMHKHERLTLSCEKCGQQFARQATLDKHVIVCQTETSCEICGKVFKCLSKNIKSRYQEHMFIHTGEKPYKCQFCDRGFRDRSTRRKHERTHTGEKPYPCTVCERAFSQLRLLRNHVRTHTGEKPYECHLCPLKFAKSCNLKYHMRVHTKEKPYTCDICNKSFTQSGTYHKHMRRHLEAKTPGENMSEKEVAATMIQFQTTTAEEEFTSDDEFLPQGEVIASPSIVHDSETTNDSLVHATIGLVVDPVDGTPSMLPDVNPEIDEDASQALSTEIISQPATDSEMPAISSEEITIIVSEGDGVAAALATIDVDQISSILASCS